MKKLFISCPMRGRSEETILHDMDRMHKVAELVFDQELEPIRSYIPGAVRGAPEGVDPMIYYLSKSIERMAEADYYIGVECLSHARGCVVENIIAERYHIPRTHVNPRDFMPDVWKKEEESWAVTAAPALL